MRKLLVVLLLLLAVHVQAEPNLDLDASLPMAVFHIQVDTIVRSHDCLFRQPGCRHADMIAKGGQTVKIYSLEYLAIPWGAINPDHTWYVPLGDFAHCIVPAQGLAIQGDWGIVFRLCEDVGL